VEGWYEVRSTKMMSSGYAGGTVAVQSRPVAGSDRRTIPALRSDILSARHYLVPVAHGKPGLIGCPAYFVLRVIQSVHGPISSVGMDNFGLRVGALA